MYEKDLKSNTKNWRGKKQVMKNRGFLRFVSGNWGNSCYFVYFKKMMEHVFSRKPMWKMMESCKSFFQTAVKPSTLDITRSKSNVLCRITFVVMMSFYDVMVNKDGHWATGYPNNGSIFYFIF